MLTIRVFPGAPLETNCYLIADEKSGEALLVDAPWQVADVILEQADALDVAVSLIVSTHGHWDHTMGLPELMRTLGAPVACHPLDADLLEHPSFAPFQFPFTLTPVTPDRLLEDGEVITVGEHHFLVLHTPGHTPGCICLYSAEDALLFSGDTLFAGTCGRMDLPGGNPQQMASSLQRLWALPHETRVFPGHGAETRLDREGWLARAEEIETW